MKPTNFVFALLFCSVSAFAESPANEVTIKSRIPELKQFPCTKCHRSYRAGEIGVASVKEHKAITYRHMPEVRECRLCHSFQNPDRLNLLDGTLVSFDDMYLVCGQCHGKMKFEWERGLHGKETGRWTGAMTRYTCAECHNPHAPKFPSMEAILDPPRSKFVIEKEAH